MAESKETTSNNKELFFETPIKIEVERYPDYKKEGQIFTLVSLDETYDITKEDLEQMVNLLNEPVINTTFFRRTMDSEEAQYFLSGESGKTGWQKKTCYGFLLKLTENGTDKIVGKLSLKQDDPEALSGSAEISYWTSQYYRGLATNAVLVLCDLAKKAGCQQLWAKTLEDNFRSQRVLTRAGFTPTEEKVRGKKKFVKNL